MTWIRPIEMNMDLSQNVLEGKWKGALLNLVQKVVLSTIIPFNLIVLVESISKLFFINLLNVGITILNSGHSLYQQFFVTS